MIDPARAPWPQGIDLDVLTGAGPLGLAVSGGGDSAALAVLLAEAGLPDLTVLTVDHRLRAGSAADADFVETLAGELGLPFERLVLREAPDGSLQAFARAARYRLLAEAAARRGLGAIATAHTLDDQAETFLLRLARGSGVRGLAAMRPRTVLDWLVVLRPFLGVRREALREALVARGLGWREDPSNADARFDRIAMRQLMPRLAAVGLSPQRLAATAAHLARAGDALDAMGRTLAADAMRVDRAGGVRLDRAALAAAPQEVFLRVLAHAVQVAGGLAHTPRFAGLAAAAERVAAGEGRISLGRAILDVDRETVRLWRERRGIETIELGPGEAAAWDGRFRVRVAAGAPRLRIGPLGSAPLACPAAALPQAVPAAPCVFVGDTPVAVPTLGLRRRDFARDNVAIRPLR